MVVTPYLDIVRHKLFDVRISRQKLVGAFFALFFVDQAGLLHELTQVLSGVSFTMLLDGGRRRRKRLSRRMEPVQ